MYLSRLLRSGLGRRAVFAAKPSLVSSVAQSERLASLQAFRRYKSIVASTSDGAEVEGKGEEETLVGDLNNFDLEESLKQRLVSVGIEALFPVQAQTFQSLKNGDDLIVRSKTGSGKTLAFSLPVADKIYRARAANSRKPGAPTAVIMSPTRELALQIHSEFSRVAPDIRCATIYGGSPIYQQTEALRRGVDVVVGTPGRMVDHLERGSLKLNAIETVVLDEADEMLKMGFEDEISAIFGAMPPKEERQTMLFSATMEDRVRSIAKSYMRKTDMIDLVGEMTAKVPEGIEMISMACERRSRLEAMGAVLEMYCKPGTRALIFAATKASAVEVSTSPYVLNSGVRCVALHGDMQQRAREVALQAFRDGDAQCLVGTDVAARGLDIPAVDLVIHEDLPMSFDSFVHRTGRTGRAGRTGTNILLHDEFDGKLERLEGFLGQKFSKRAVPGGKLIKERREKALQTKVENTPEDKKAQCAPLARSLLRAKVGDEPVPAGVLDLLSASLSYLVDMANAPDFSLLRGTRGMVTLSYPEVPNSRFKIREGTKKLPPGLLRGIASSMDIEINELLRATGTAMPAELESGRREKLSHNVAVGSDSRVFFDVQSSLAAAIMQAQDTPAGTGPLPHKFSFLAVDEKLPELFEVVQSSFGGDRRGGRRPDFRGDGGHFQRKSAMSSFERKHPHRPDHEGGYSGHRNQDRGGYRGPRQNNSSRYSRESWY